MPLRLSFLGLLLCGALQLAGHAAAAAVVHPDSVAVPASVYFHKTYSGKIAGKYPFTMTLINRKGALSGSYRYTGKDDIDLKGRIDAAGKFTLDEESDSKRTGVFRGTLNEGNIAGTWESANRAKTFAFSAGQTSEIQVGSKQDILRQAVGTYPLHEFGGTGGNNSQWETWRQKGTWQSNHSGLSEGRREATYIALSDAEIRLLDSMKVVVAADMSVRLHAGGKTLLDIPYRPSGVQYQVKEVSNSSVDDLLAALASGPSVLEEDVYLLARDEVDFSDVISGSFQGNPAGILIVSYSVARREVDVRFVEPTCCGGTTFSFRRAPRK